MRWLLLCLLVGCAASPSSESPVCDVSPNARFVRANEALVVDPLAIAVGGTATVQLQCWFSDYPGEAPFDLPSVATTDSDAASVAKTDATLVVQALHAGTTTVTITSSDGSTTYGSMELDVEAIDHLAFSSTYDDIPPNVDVAFAKEFGTLGEVLLAASTGDVLVDDSMELVPPSGATPTGIRPGSFDYTATPLGNNVVEVDSGGAMYTTPFVVVDHADSIALVDPSVTIPADGSTQDICFAATVNARFVASLRWSFVIEGFSDGGSNCEATSQAEDANHDGMLTMSATAGGASAQVNVPIQ